MSEFAVYRTLGNGRCLVLDDTRIAGGKPDYRGNNYITSWVTKKTYGPVDELKSENAKLRELAHLVADYVSADQCEGCVTKRACNAGELDMCWIRKAILEKLRELEVEVVE